VRSSTLPIIFCASLPLMPWSSNTSEIFPDTLRQGKEDAARRRSALPELRLVSQVRTLSMKRADISAGERTYRVTDGRPFRMALSNDEIVTATPTFLQDGTVEVSIKDLDATQMLSFRPSPPDPSRARARSSRASDG
jgi:hypothetical protein